MRLRTIGWALALVAGVATAASAEVVSSGATGFQTRHVVQSPMTTSAAYQRFLAVGQWWTDAHTYSGKASALSIEPKAGGCWCEQLANGGSVRHLAVDMVMPNTMLRFQGGLGPLGSMGVSGAMTVTFTAKGQGTEVTVVYNVSGYNADGFGVMSKLVDAVLTQAFGRYADAK